MSKTALVILNYNNCRDTKNCVESVLKFNTAEVKFIIVDNASKKEDRDALADSMAEIFGDQLCVTTPNTLRNSLPFATLVLNDKNDGYAQGNNIGLNLAYADSDIDKVMILNNDILFVEDIIPTLSQRLDKMANCALLSPMLYKPGLTELDYNCARRNESVKDMIKKNFLHYWWRYKQISTRQAFPNRYILNDTEAHSGQSTLEIELPSGSCMIAKKEIFKQIGSFDPNTFLYYEENILYKKISKLGLKNYLCHDLKCVHLGAATTNTIPKSTIIIKSNIDSQYYYALKYSGASPLLIAALRFSQFFFLLSFRLQKSLSR